MNNHNRVIVIGAGIAGLGAATFLKQRGYDVQVLEAAPQAGGRARTLTRRGTEDFCDVGTQYYHSNCGDYLSGGYLEPALWSAERAAAVIK